MGRYVFDNAWEHERERLAGLEAGHDPGTRSIVEELGIAPRWWCLEIAGGGGSIARWMCERVGSSGRVVATDLDTRFLDAIPLPNLHVMRHDVLKHDLPEAQFDLVHARLLVEHLPDRDLALKRMISALKPGGWLLVEDADWGPWMSRPATALVHPSSFLRSSVRVVRGLLKLLTSAGYDPIYGRRLPSELINQGLVDVGAEMRSRLTRGGDPQSAVPRWSLIELKDKLVGAGVLRASEIDAQIRRFEDPETAGFGLVMVSAWGRRPGVGGAPRSDVTAFVRRREEVAERLEALPLLAGCTHAQRDRIAALAHELEVPTGHVLTRESTPGASFFVIEGGTATVSREGRSLAALGPGSFFGEIALVEGGQRTATVTADTPMRLLAFEVHEFSSLMREVPPLAEKIARSVAERRRALEENTAR